MQKGRPVHAVRYDYIQEFAKALDMVIINEKESL
jgi:hypothetical protein